MHSDPIVNVLLSLSVVIFAGKIGAVIAHSFKQPLVLGELLAGVALASFSLFGLSEFDFLKDNSVLEIFAALGVVILLFEVGLESQLSEMVAVGTKSLLVATVGVIIPFILGYYVSGMIIQDLPNVSKIFIGAMLTATSVGITARVFKDLNFLNTKEAKIVLGAAVIDDILGLIILAIVSSIAITGAVDMLSISTISLKAIAFIALSVLAGLLLGKKSINFITNKWNIPGMMLSLALAICFMGAYLANQFGLATIVGAFCMGLILDDVHFKHLNSDKTLEEYIQPISIFLIPIFFVVTGLHVDVSVLEDTTVIYSSIALSTVAIFSKLACGWAFLTKEKFNRFLIGVGMIPRGEVGLIFASVGKSIGVVDDKLYAIAVIVVITTTLVTPPLLAFLINKLPKQEINEQS